MGENFELTPKEKEIVREVRTENFYFVAVPLVATSTGICHILMRKGIFSSTRPFLKYFLAGMTGYTLSFAPFTNKLRERLLAEAPDGTFARSVKETEGMTREQRKVYYTEKQRQMQREKMDNTAVPAPQEGTSRHQGTMDLFQQTDSSITKPPESVPPPKVEFSYSKQRSSEPLWSKPSYTDDDVPPSKLRPVKRTKYGDEME